MKLKKAAIGNRKLADFEELKDVVVDHRTKMRLIPCAFCIENERNAMLHEFT